MELAIKENLGLMVQTRNQERETILNNEIVRAKLQENELAVASLGLKKPIKLFAEAELVQAVGAVSKGLSRDIGLKGASGPDFQYDVFRFMEVLKKYYSNLSIEEVKTAFELALVGALDEYLPKDKNGQPDRNHYQSFSLDYITKILKAFEQYKNKVWGKALNALPEPERVFSPEEIQEAREGVEQDILDKFKEFKETGLMPDFLAPSLVVKVLHQKGIITEICPVSEADVRKSLFTVQLSNTLSEFDKHKIREKFDSGEIHSRHKIEAERLRDLGLIRETFEKIEELKLKTSENGNSISDKTKNI